MALRPGTRVGPYEILAAVGAGGMGEVYRARDTRLGREVAIKVLHVTVPDVDIGPRLDREARIVASLNHPHICQLYDVGREGGVPFLVMEFLEGETLANRLVRGPLPIEQALRFGVQIAGAMDAAHRRGVVHRDLKPGNIMLTRSGAKLLDFGLAKPVMPSVHLQLSMDSTAEIKPPTGTGHTTVGGTLPYMAPEQLEGKEADARADIFSFGAVLYEMVTGHRAFSGDSAGRIVAAVMTEDPRRMSRFQPDVTPALEELVATCMAKDRDERWQSARDLSRTLTWVAEGSGSVSRDEATTLLRNAAFRGRGRNVWPVVTAALVLATLGGIATWRTAPVTAQPRNIVVLPCRSLGDATERPFCDGIAETLAAKLSQLSSSHSLQVVPASQVRSERVTNAEEARATLGATLALEGSLLRAGDTFRLNYVLIDTISRQQVDAVSLTTPANDPFGLQDQAVQWATRVLQVRLSAEENRAIRARPTQAGNAFEPYQRGRGLLLAAQTGKDVDEAITLFEAAVAADPQFAHAHASLGEAYWQRFEETADTADVDRARDACTRAATLSPDLPAASFCAAKLALGTGQLPEALAAFQRTVERDPTIDDAYLGIGRTYDTMKDSAAAERTYRDAVNRRPRYWRTHYWLGAFYFQHGRFEEALAAYQRAVQLNPGNAQVHAVVGAAYTYLGRYSDAVTSFQVSAAIVPTWGAYNNWGMTLFRMRDFGGSATQITRACELRPAYQCLGNLSRSYFWAGRKEESTVLAERAIALALENLQINPADLDARLSLADYYARLGRREAALDQIARTDPGASWHRRFFIALAHAQLGDRDEAFKALQQSVADGAPDAELRAWPELDALKSDPRFAALTAARR
jgi:tetratricopeptide (TPR) repeat protein